MTALPHPAQPAAPLAERWAAVRAQTLLLAAPLSEADCQVQSMPDASPVKWHLAHVTWFFETFVLERHERGFKPHREPYRVLFNSYYNGVGDQHPRTQRGLITRPGLAEVLAYRAQVDARVAALLAAPHAGEVDTLVELGLQHEQQHQELILTDVLHLLSCNPLAPAYQPRGPLAQVAPVAQAWLPMAGGLVDIGHDGTGFAFDNEAPRHGHYLRPYALARRPSSHGEWLAFVADGGYADARWWLSAGWDWVRSQRIEAPLYWRRSGNAQPDDWHRFTLHGLVPVDAHTPITHISYFEADAFARWWSAQHPAQPPARLPTEAEWEQAAQRQPAALLAAGNFLESGSLDPMPASPAPTGPLQLLGDVWEWTASPYTPYPGFRAWDGAVGEYNAKFMVNQMVLRGGSCATPRSHIRPSYRNFFPTDTRWQFNGLRLARDEP
ncbi:MAG: ergothioneine biosynthesis protein EgtB [Aquabacterium sp.]|nr:ergothioneine biosynthesis protein EgtB [Aquabacterium sp.]